MPGRNEKEAWRAFADPVKRAIGAVDLTARLVEKHFSEDDVHILSSAPPGIPFGNLTLSFSINVTPLPGESGGEWRMTTTRYDYALERVTSKRREQVVGWHWHPRSCRSDVLYPHVHVPSANSYSTRHIPTGRVALEDVIMFGFDDLGVAPTSDRAWQIVADVRDRHKEFRSWG